MAVACALIGVYHDAIFGLFRDREALQAFLAGFGPSAPLVAILVGALQVVVAPLPGQLVGVATGYLFGPSLGTLYAMAGLVLGTAAAMGIGRWLGRPWVERFVARERLARWDGLARRHGLVFFFAVFLLPFLPDDLACFAMGLSPLPFGPMLLVAALGRLPGMAVACFVGDHLDAIPAWGWALVVLGALVVMAALVRYGARLEAATLKLAEKMDAGGPRSPREPRSRT
jgi:uncharacterized membrane protein YdjX (TVP38/TMEM64 family)